MDAQMVLSIYYLRLLHISNIERIKQDTYNYNEENEATLTALLTCMLHLHQLIRKKSLIKLPKHMNIEAHIKYCMSSANMKNSDL